MDRGAWRATVHGAAKSQTRLSDCAAAAARASLPPALKACDPRGHVCCVPKKMSPRPKPRSQGLW